MANYKLFNKDCRSMTELPDNSIHAVCTSPPYWGLRKYSGEQELIWGGEKDSQHDFLTETLTVETFARCGHIGDFREVTSPRTVYPERYQKVKHERGFCRLCGAWKGSYGLEPTTEMYVEHTLEILREIRRVLRPDGVVFWNIGNTYASGKGTCFNPGGGKGSFSGHGDRKDAGAYPLDRGNMSMLKANGLKPLDLCLIPERLAIAARDDGWWVRSVIIWSKSNPMPESVNGWRWEQHRTLQWPDGRPYEGVKNQKHPPEVTLQDCPGCPKCLPNDGLVLRLGSWRPTDAHEYILMLTKTDSYYCDAEAVREAYTEPLNRWGGDTLKRDTSKTTEYKEMQNIGYSSAFRVGRPMRPNESGRNLRSVWSFPTQSYRGAHFATFPEKLPELCIKAATPEVGVCAKCGAPWARILKHIVPDFPKTKRAEPYSHGSASSCLNVSNTTDNYKPTTETLGWKPTCSCNCPEKIPAVVLDPFAGAGTTLKVAIKLGRDAVGYELSSDYCEMIKKRVTGVQIRYS